jgi:hypothetical protein
MKNNKIIFSQFLAVCFLCSLSSIMFVKSTPSIFVLVLSASALAVNYLVFLLYKGQLKKYIFPICFIYLTFFLIHIVVKFSDYMNTALSYGPACLIIVVLLFFTFFCTVKGSETVARASTVISVFVTAGIIYMLVCTFTNINFNIVFELPEDYNVPAILLLPSVLYVLFYDNITNFKAGFYIGYSALILVIIFYFLLIASGIKSVYPIQYLPAVSEIGVFKGADCVLLSFLTVSCVFSVSFSTVGLFKSFKHKYITNAVYIAFIMIISIIIHYFRLLSFIEKHIFPWFSMLIILLITVLSLCKRKTMYKNS